MQEIDRRAVPSPQWAWPLCPKPQVPCRSATSRLELQNRKTSSRML